MWPSIATNSLFARMFNVRLEFHFQNHLLKLSVLVSSMLLRAGKP